MKKKKSTTSSKKNSKHSAYNSSEKLDILNKLGNISSATKKEIKKDAKHGLFKSEERTKREIGRNTSDNILHYEIDEDDNIFINTIISIINERKITTQWIYDRIYYLYPDEFPTYEKARSTGYNLIYALTVKKELGIPRIFQWFEILNVKDFQLTYKLGDIDDTEEDCIDEDDYDIDEDYEEDDEE